MAHKPLVPNRPAARSPQAVHRLRTQYLQAAERGDFTTALRFAMQVWTMSKAPGWLANVALCQMRLGQLQPSYDTYSRVLRQLQTADVYDGMAEVAGQLNRRDEARHFGTQSLLLKVQEAQKGRPAATVPGWETAPPPPFDARDPGRNAIAFSLFGGDARYCEMAVLNVRAARDLFPGWHCRFYVNDTVPAALQARLVQEGAWVIQAAQLGCADLPGTTWRFLALDDPTLDRVQCRDADSLVSTRDQAAVQAWCASDRWFHVMRDSHAHTELMLAGMWGACRGALQSMAQELRAYLAVASFTKRLVDQQFLRQRVWQVAQRSLLMHDEWFGLPDALPFPPHPPMAVHSRYAHVGANVGAPIMEVQYVAPEGTRVQWTLRDERDATVCSYEAVVSAGRYKVCIPEPYAANIGAGRWRVVTHGIAGR